MSTPPQDSARDRHRGGATTRRRRPTGTPGAITIAVLLAACGGADPAPLDVSVENLGDHPVGTARFTLDDDARTRRLGGQVWYPAVEDARAAAETGFATDGFEDEPHRATYADLLAAAPSGCPTRRARAAIEAVAAPGRFPLVLFSHCHQCTRFSSFTVAERLASHGFIVAAVDHTDNTLFDHLAGTGAALDAAFLQVRGADVRFLLDQLEARAIAPAGFRPDAVDLDQVGVFGHSFGAVTAGLVAQDDDRIDAAFGIAAPMENPLLEGVAIVALDLPLGFLVAVEDNSITELGNTFLRDNYAAAPGPAWKIEVADAGHWSFSDLVGVAEPFPAGCGDGRRQTNGAAFTYLQPSFGRDIAAAYVTAFFRATLGGDRGAEAYLTSARGPGTITATAHD